MFWKWLKRGLVCISLFCLVGGLFFGKDLASYVRSTAGSVRAAVKDSVPVEFELKRAGDLLEQIIPEMHANIRRIAEEEVEIAALQSDIARGSEQLAQKRLYIKKLRTKLDKDKPQYILCEQNWSRAEVRRELADRFDRFTEAQLMLRSKQSLLASRRQSLRAAMQFLEKTRSQKRVLTDKIELLEGKYRLIQAAAAESPVDIDNSKLSQAKRLIRQIKKRLAVAERVLAHENRFVPPVPVDSINEADLLVRVDEYFAGSKQDNSSPEAEAASKENELLFKPASEESGMLIREFGSKADGERSSG